MAAREHQGLQIALIVFVMLTIILAVATFLFYRSYDEEVTKAKALETQAKEAVKKANDTDDYAAKLRREMFGNADAKPDDAEAQFKTDIKAYGKGADPDKFSYHQLADALGTELRKAQGEIGDLSLAKGKLEEKIRADEAARSLALQKYDEDINKSSSTLASERGAFDKERNRIVQEEGNLKTKVESAIKTFEKQATDAANSQKQLAEKIKKQTNVISDLEDKMKTDYASNEVADGQVTWVNQAARTVWINVGEDDHLRRQTSFSVLSADENNVEKGKKKASIEVTKVLDKHLAEARIVDDDDANPVMPGDQIYSPVWQPGRADRFALAGFMDLDGDGISDRQKIRDIIQLNGGIIDAEVADDGKMTGELSIHTKYLVVGDPPDSKNSGAAKGSSKTLDGWSKITADAKSLGVRTMSVQDLLDYLGYKPKERSVALGKDAKASDFAPRIENGVQRKSTTQIFDFKPRRPPASKSAR